MTWHDEEVARGNRDGWRTLGVVVFATALVALAWLTTT